MKKMTKRRIAWAVVPIMVGFAALNALAYNHARSMMHFTAEGDLTHKPEALSIRQKAQVLLSGINIPRPTAEQPPTSLAADCRTLPIRTPQQITLDTWYCDLGASTPLTILFHGYAVEKTSLLPEARALLEMGSSVLLVDFRGSGGSSEAYTTIGIHEADDVTAVVRYAEQHLAHTGRLLFGQSMGAVAILRAVHKDGLRPDAVILEAVFDTMVNTVRNRFHAMRVPAFPAAHLLVFWGGQQWGFDGFSHNPLAYAADLHYPALFMHGRDDPRATVDEGRRVYAAVPGPKSFVEFEDTGHESYAVAHPDAWRAAVGEMVQTVRDGTQMCGVEEEHGR